MITINKYRISTDNIPGIWQEINMHFINEAELKQWIEKFCIERKIKPSELDLYSIRKAK